MGQWIKQQQPFGDFVVNEHFVLVPKCISMNLASIFDETITNEIGVQYERIPANTQRNKYVIITLKRHFWRNNCVFITCCVCNDATACSVKLKSERIHDIYQRSNLQRLKALMVFMCVSIRQPILQTDCRHLINIGSCFQGPVSQLQWRHNGHVGVSNHQPHVCLLNRLFRRRSKKTSKLRVTGLCEGSDRWLPCTKGQ